MSVGRLSDRIAVVTGAGRGIGKAIALNLAREGAGVVVAEIRADLAAQAVEELKTITRDVLQVVMDVSNSSDVEKMATTVYDRFGQIDILVNNAGINTIAPIVEFEEELWDRAFDVNLKGAFLCCKYLAPYMIRQKSGKIVNIASIQGKAGKQTRGAYSASKFALIGLTQVLAKELAPHNINVNAVCPGAIFTDMWQYIWEREASKEYSSPREYYNHRIASAVPLAREVTPEDVAKTVVFLASDDSRNITGQAINVCGGLLIR